MPIKDEDEEKGQGDPDGVQRTDEWGGRLQNEYGRALWRIESKLDRHTGQFAEITEKAKTREQDIKQIRQRQGDDFHKINNDLQKLSSQADKQAVSIDTINERVKMASVQIESVGKRVDRLDVPYDEGVAARDAAIKIRDAKRARWNKYAGYIAIAGGALWAVGDPIWKALAPAMLQRFFSGGSQ